MKNALTVGVLLLLAGCGATTLQDLDENRAPQTITLNGRTYRATGNEAYGASNREFPIPLSAERLWSALPPVFEELRLEPNRVDARNMILGIENVRLNRVAGQRPSRFVECGQSVGGSLADTQELTFTLLTQVANAGEEGSVLRVVVNSSVRNRNHGGGVTQCRTKGELENLVAAIAKEIAGVP